MSLTGIAAAVAAAAKHALWLVVGLAAGLIGLQLLSAYLLVSYFHGDLVHQSIDEVDALSELVANSVRQPLRDGDHDGAAAVVRTFAADPRFVAIEVRTAADAVLLDYTRPGAVLDDTLERIVPLFQDDRRIGTVRARFARHTLIAEAGGDWRGLVEVIALQLAFSAGAAWLLVRLAMRRGRQQTLEVANRALQAEIEEREKYAQALRASEQNLRDVLNALPTSVFYVDTDYRFRVANRVFCEWWNTSEADIVGKTYREVFGPARGLLFEANMLRSNAGEAFTVQTTLESFDGRKREVDIVHAPDFDAAGQVRGAFIITADITERNRSSRELASSQHLLQETIDAAPVAITIKDRQQNYVLANRAALDKFGRTADQVIGRKLADARLFPEDPLYIGAVSDIDEDVFTTGVALPLTAFSIDKKGAWRETLVSKTSIREANGRISHVVTVSADVTELKDVEARALALKEEAELANAAKSMFLANMSHELRTPLNAIIGFSEILMDQRFGPVGNEKYVEYARDIHQSGDHLHAIITDLLDLARIDVGAIELDLAEVDLAAVLHDTRTMLQRKADMAGVALVERFAAGLPKVMGDAVRLRQIFINLVDNAIKFTDRGGKIVISGAVPQTGTIAITVADDGIGIAGSDIERVVEPFVHLPGPALRNVSGTGLGLSLVKSLCELHGGTIRIDSEPGRGTAVTVTFPCAPAAASMPLAVTIAAPYI